MSDLDKNKHDERPYAIKLLRTKLLRTGEQALLKFKNMMKVSLQHL